MCRQAEQSGEKANLDHHPENGGCGGLPLRGTLFSAPRGRVASRRSHWRSPQRRREPGRCRRSFAQFCKKPPCDGWICRTATPKCGKQKMPSTITTSAVGTAIRKARPPVCFGPSKLSSTDGENCRSCELFRMRHAKVLKCRERADCRSHQVIGNEEKTADDRNDLRAMADAGVNAAAIRVESTDDDIVDTDQRREHAHRGDKPKRGVAFRPPKASPMT